MWTKADWQAHYAKMHKNNSRPRPRIASVKLGDTINGVKVVEYVKGGKFRCICTCGRERFVDTYYLSSRTIESVCKLCKYNRSYFRRVDIWRSAVLARDNTTCQGPGPHKGILSVHHIKPSKFFPELRFTVANGLTVCRACHRKFEIGSLRFVLERFFREGFTAKARSNELARCEIDRLFRELTSKIEDVSIKIDKGADVQTIKVVISPTGDATVSVNGVKGAACKDLTRNLEQALGQVVNDVATNEMYEVEGDQTVTV